jgi:molecular chaperone DnaK (HSP70)
VQIQQVLLVGGSTRIPLVREMVSNLFEKQPRGEIDPDLVVAMGAAVQADILAGGTKDMLLLDVTPLSLGIEGFGDTMEVLIPRNSTIPASAKEGFTTAVDNQTAVVVNVRQGERALASQNRGLATFNLNVDPLAAGLARVEVEFLIDADGILNVTARDLRTMKGQTVEVIPSHGLTDDEVKAMVEEGKKFSGQDMATRFVVEARTEVDLILNAARKALAKGEEVGVDPERMASFRKQIEDLDAAKAAEHHLPIQMALREFNENTKDVAALVMDAAVKAAMKGRQMEEM